MSHGNVEIVRAGYAAFNRGDIEAIVATLDPAPGRSSKCASTARRPRPSKP
jgi:hypothetical protein